MPLNLKKTTRAYTGDVGCRILQIPLFSKFLYSPNSFILQIPLFSKFLYSPILYLIYLYPDPAPNFASPAQLCVTK